MEWKNKSKYNSFNSYKGLCYIDHYRHIINKQLLPPVECSFDPIHLCNYNCFYCNAQRYLRINPEEININKKIMSKEHSYNLVDFLLNWGVSGFCFGGGGSPLMNKNILHLPSFIKKRGGESSFATNGSLINEEWATEMMNCRWVGISVDAGDPITFSLMHRVSEKIFYKVINNIKLLVKMKKQTKSKVDIAYKILIHPYNMDSILNACKLAKDLGVKDFHVRPMDLERKDFKTVEEININISKIKNIFDKCHKLEDENFRVFTVLHKYDKNFKVKHDFKKCLSSPLMIQVCADGNCYVCADHRLEKRFCIGSHYPDPKNILNFWGSKKHLDLLDSINVDRECGRCTYGEYATQIEQVIMEDGMCLNFP